METIILWVLTLGAVGLSAMRFARILSWVRAGGGDARLDGLGQRLSTVVRDIGLHRRLLRFRLAGIAHFLIFTSFIVLMTAIMQAFGSGLFPGFSLVPIGGETWIALAQEIFSVLIFIGLGLAIYQRFVIKPTRFEGSNSRDATIIYILVFGVVSTMLAEFTFALLAEGRGGSVWRPVSTALMQAMAAAGIMADTARWLTQMFYWLHVTMILVFLVYIPDSKHRHILFAAPNILFRDTGAKGALVPPSSGDSTPLSWKHRLDLFSCTECGRCQSVCPAHGSGLPLSPKKLIMALRDGAGDSSSPLGIVGSGTAWSCTTCRACMDVCPLHIEHVPKLVDIRRELVEAGTLEPMLQSAMQNVQQYGNSFGKPEHGRARWVKGLDFKVQDAREEPVDFLWFVGDYASFDPRAQENTRRVATLLNAAGVDFGILYDGEQNSGNDVRRVGKEGLFDMLSQHNVDEISACDFNRIMTTDPHSLNALANEYRALGGAWEIVHYSVLLNDLLVAGRLVPAQLGGGKATYHDPCFLGRYNGEYDAPRGLIRASGTGLVDMPRCRENSYCCGAGGGRIWMDDSAMIERPSENRIKEALSLDGVEIFATACPKDFVMYNAAVDSLGMKDRLKVLDIASFVAVPEAD